MKNIGYRLSIILCHVALLFSESLMSAEETRINQNTADNLQALMLDWTGLERQKDLLSNSWREQQPILEQQIYLLEIEQQELSSLIEETANIQDEVESERLQLLEDQTALEQEQLLLEQSLNEAIANIERLFPLLPPPMEVAWQDSLPDLKSELLTASERLLLVVEMFTQLDDFQQKITLHETVMQVEDGSQYFVKQVYLGVSQGWYISTDGSQAAYGSVTQQGWRWEPSMDGGVIAEFIAMVEGSLPAALLSIPLTLVPSFSIDTPGNSLNQ
jgi:hypothetical protein